ncbi:GNAT family N-acetyltransferase [Phenylobacterium sp.]|uniref:GNAT family N-acetyltransferase n=1 Tax=Phenylobacterium sp. TaxID=1871053 RepID=UPI0037852760
MARSFLDPTPRLATGRLETERLRLEPLTEGDAEPLFRIMDDPEVMAYWDTSEGDDPDVVAEIVRGQVEAMSTGKAVHWTLRKLEDGDFVGVCDLTEIDRRSGEAEVGFMLGRDAWGKGYALEALGSVAAFAAGSGLRRLKARTHLGARRSESLLQKLGFEEQGLVRGHRLPNGDRRDFRLFELQL